MEAKYLKPYLNYCKEVNKQPTMNELNNVVVKDKLIKHHIRELFNSLSNMRGGERNEKI